MEQTGDRAAEPQAVKLWASGGIVSELLHRQGLISMGLRSKEKTASGPSLFDRFIDGIPPGTEA